MKAKASVKPKKAPKNRKSRFSYSKPGQVKIHKKSGQGSK